MPNASAPKPERTFCSNCGFPVRGGRCDACGAAQEPPTERDTGDEDVPTKQVQQRQYAPEVEVEPEGLERAFDAYRNKDTGRFIEHLIVAEGVGTARTAPSPDGAAWILAVRGSVVFVTLRASADELVVEVPIARVPTRQRLPAMRLALELCARDAPSSRVCLRGDLFMLRFVVRASMLSPLMLRHHLREAGHLASRYAGLMTLSLDALPAIPEDLRASAGFEVLGRARKIMLGGGGSIRRSIPPPGMPQEASRPASISMGRPGPVPPRQRHEDEPPSDQVDSLPAILSPMFSLGQHEAPAPAAQAQAWPFEQSSAPAAAPAPQAAAPAPQARPAAAYEATSPGWPEERGKRTHASEGRRLAVSPSGVTRASEAEFEARRLEAPHEVHANNQRPRAPAEVPYEGPAAWPSEAAWEPVREVAPKARPTTDPAHEIPKARPATDPAHDVSRGRHPVESSSDGVRLRAIAEAPEAKPRTGMTPGLPASDRLCMLLRHAQSLASLTIEERPSSMPWLVRSTVYRAIYEFKEAVPDAVAHLYRTIGVGRGASDSSEPALLVMERVIVARGQMSKEKPLQLDPMTSAAQAKEHVARYLSEIERAPADPSLRHFLALGALTELLVRTKLPPQTDQRLRDIVAHAQREGAKVSAIDLMMTALQRINS